MSWQSVGEDVLAQVIGSVIAVATVGAGSWLIRSWRQRTQARGHQVDEAASVQDSAREGTGC
jgi:hypothetical protein